MAVSSQARFDVSDVALKMGDTIQTDKATLQSGDRAADIRRILEQRGVIVFPEINLTDDEQIAFTHTLGVFAHEEGEGAAGKDSVYPITMDERIKRFATLLAFRGADRTE